MRRLALLTLPLLVVGCNKTGNPLIPDTILGTCTYTNRFSDREECREYRGDLWTEDAAVADCSDWNSTFKPGETCEYESILGACILGDGEKVTRVVVPGADARNCRQQERGCELFGGGIFVPAPLCGGEDLPEAEGTVFQWPVLECRQPSEGEPPGLADNGDVCTWSMISGCTEPGRKFAEYASCDMVRTQRPYSAVPPFPAPADPDPRMDDPAYVEELAWVTEQVEACACVCCHQTSITPEGAAVWDIDIPGNWVNSFSPYGLAFAGGFLDSSLLGAYPADQNNGFDRTDIGIPTTDRARMSAFFQKELEFRGMSPADFADADPTPAPFYQQWIYEPTACAEGEGVAADQTITWTGGRARYVYVLDAGSLNPGVPPNLDLPAGTRWRVDIPWDGESLASGAVRYGTIPDGARQAFPAEGSPTALEPGKSYYLYVLADIAIPITRCTFTYSG